MSDDRGRLRISNDDRDQAIARLQRALDEGRINLSEFDDRSRGVYEAKTNAELDVIFDDLPMDRAQDRSVHTIDLTDQERQERERAAQERVKGGKSGTRLPDSLHGLVWVAVPTISIWLISSIASGELLYFWPAWPVGIMIAIVLAQWLTGDRGRSKDC